MLDGERVLFAYSYQRMTRDAGTAAEWVAAKAKEAGITRISVTSGPIGEALRRFGIEATRLPEDEAETLNSRKLSIIVASGIAANEQEALEIVRQSALIAAERAITVQSSRQDLHLVQAIQALDDLDRFLNITTERVSEWYGLHFPELLDLLQDSLLLCKLVAAAGRRENLTEEMLAGRGLSEKKIEAIITAKETSKGGTISDRDIRRLSDLADLAVKTSGMRDKMAEDVESTMAKIAPNTSSVAGATTGARLIAKAGGLDRLAILPASTIQILGAEKALFRALRTGSRPPKHGILFQHEAVHTAPKWQRGKIARTLANKVAIGARIDYYRGEPEKSLTGLLEKRLEQIRIRYKEPRTVAPQRERTRDKKPPRGRKERKGKHRYQKPRPQ